MLTTNVQAACERGLAAMQESHRIALAELQRQKDQELQAQREEQERLLVEEAAATAAGQPLGSQHDVWYCVYQNVDDVL